MIEKLGKLTLLLSVLLCLALPRAGWAAPPPIREQLPAEAKKDWDAARELYDAGNHKGALVHFERAYEISKNPRVLFNVGVCWKDLTLYAQAIRTWERQLESRSELDREDVARAEEAIAAARPFVSTLKVESDQAGAMLSVDGMQIGTTPFAQPIPIDVGRRSVTLDKDGFTPMEKTVVVVQGKPLTMTMNLVPVLRTGTVAITVVGAPSATIFMDGRELGRAPYSGEVPAGPHTFEGRATGYAVTRRTIEVGFDQKLDLTLSLAKARSEGKLRVTADQRDAAIRIDGKLVGRGAWEGLLPSGGHQLRVEKAGYETHTDDVSLAGGQQRTVEVRLEKSQSWVWWTVSLAAVVGGGTVAAVLLSQPSETPPVNGSLSPGTVSGRF
jgi:hypothetical protein